MSKLKLRSFTNIYICYVIVIIAVSLCVGLHSGIDNYLMSNVKANVYSDNSYCLYLGAILNYLLSAIARLLPNSDCFALMRILFTILGLSWLGWIFYKADNNTSKLLVSYIGIITVCKLFDLGRCNFTITAALFTVIGFVSLSYYIGRRTNISGLVLGAVYLFLGYQWRSKAFFLVIPFVALSALFYLIKSRKNGFNIGKKRFSAVIIAVIVCFSLAMGVQLITGNSEVSQDNVSYNNARTLMVDYPNYNYSEIEKELSSMGVSENDYLAIDSMILCDREIVTSEYLGEIANVSQYREHNLVALLEIINYHAKNLTYTAYLSIAFLMIVTTAVSVKNSELSLELILSVLGCAVLIVALIIMGRITDWVIKALVIYAFLPLLLHYPKIEAGRYSAVIIFAVCLFSLSLLNSFFSGALFNPINTFSAKVDNERSEMARFCDNSNNYVWDVYSLDDAILSTYGKAGKLLPKDFIDNNIADGEWTYGQDYYNEYLDRNAMENPMKSLLYEDSWYYVGGEDRCRIIETWLQEHYDENAAAVIVDRYNDVPIWSFVIE